VQPQQASPRRAQPGQLITSPAKQQQQRQQQTHQRPCCAYRRKSGFQSPARREQLEAQSGAAQLPSAAHAVRRGNSSPSRRSRSVNVIKQPEVNSKSLTFTAPERTETAISMTACTPPRPAAILGQTRLPGRGALRLSKIQEPQQVTQTTCSSVEDSAFEDLRVFVGGSAGLYPQPGPTPLAVTEMEPVELLQGPCVAGESDNLADNSGIEHSIHLGAQRCPSRQDLLANPTSTTGVPQRRSSCLLVPSNNTCSVTLTPAVTGCNAVSPHGTQMSSYRNVFGAEHAAVHGTLAAGTSIVGESAFCSDHAGCSANSMFVPELLYFAD